MCIACIYLDDMQAHRFKKYQSYIYPQKGKFKIEIIAFNKKNWHHVYSTETKYK